MCFNMVPVLFISNIMMKIMHYCRYTDMYRIRVQKWPINLFSIFFHPILLAIRIFIKKYQISYLTAL